MDTIASYNEKLRKFYTDLEANNRPFALAVQTSVQQIGNRIFVDGKKTDGSAIGSYNSTNEIYIDPNTAPTQQGFSKPPKGKTGKSVFKSTGKPHKTQFFESYKDYRSTTGRESAFINLRNSGDLQSDFRKAKEGEPANPTKINQNHYTIQLDRKDALTGVSNAKKLQGNEDRFGEISTPSQKENADFIKINKLELLNALEKAGLT